MIKCCIFDMDGLLIDSERCMWTVSMNKAAKKQGFVLTQELHNSYMGMNFAGVKQILEKNFGSNFDFDLFIEDTYKNNELIIEEGIPLRPGVIELLEYLKMNNIKTCIGTTTARSVTNKILSVVDIGKYFDGIVCGDEVKNGKPDPEIYLTCLGKFKGVKKEEALVFEDGQAGAYASISAGIRLVLVPDLAYLNEEVRSKAYQVIGNLKDMIPFIEEENKK